MKRLLSNFWEATALFVTTYVWHMCIRPLLGVPSTTSGDVASINSPKGLEIADSPLSSTESSTSEDVIPAIVNQNLETAFISTDSEPISSEPTTTQSLYILEEVTKVLVATSNQTIASNVTTAIPNDSIMKMNETDVSMKFSTTTSSSLLQTPSLRILEGMVLEPSANNSPSVHRLHDDNYHIDSSHTTRVAVENTTLPPPPPPPLSSPPKSPSKYIPVGYTSHVESVWGRMYYCDTTSGETMWTLPGDLPPGWLAQLDHVTGDLFYVEQATGLTQWKIPTDITPTSSLPTLASVSYETQPISTPVLSAVLHALENENSQGDDYDMIGILEQERIPRQGQGQEQSNQLDEQLYHENPLYRLLQSKNSPGQTIQTLERRSNNMPSPPPLPAEPVPSVVMIMNQQQPQQYNVNTTTVLPSNPPSNHPVERFSTLYLPNASPTLTKTPSNASIVIPPPATSQSSTIPHPPSTPPRSRAVSDIIPHSNMYLTPSPPPSTSIEGQNNEMGGPGKSNGQLPVRPFSHCFSAPHGGMNDSIDRNVGGSGYHSINNSKYNSNTNSNASTPPQNIPLSRVPSFTDSMLSSDIYNGEIDIRTVGLLPWQLDLVASTLATPSLSSAALHAKASATHMRINAFLVYRYLAATEWSRKYDGKSVEEAIVGTVNWRLKFRIHTLQTSRFAHLVQAGLGYTGGKDQHGRVILYMKVARNSKKMESNQTYLNLLMYTLERADRICAERDKGSNGEFVALIDLEGFSITRGLPFSVIQEFFTHTSHYPFRLAAIYLINSNTAFNALWGIIKLMLPKRIAKTTYMLNKSTATRVLCEHLGRNHVEQSYGGTLPEGPGDILHYFASGYWETAAVGSIKQPEPGMEEMKMRASSGRY